MVEKRIETTDNLDLLLEVLPHHIREKLIENDRLEKLIEVVLDLGREPEARFPGQAVYLGNGLVTREDLHHVVSRVGAFTKDNRAGIERTLHRISAMRNRLGEIVGLTCRVGRAVFGTVEIIRDVVESGKSILLMGKPGVGKTTLLREAARVLADDLNKRVIVVDTSNEIAGDGDVPHPGIGRSRRMQVPSPEMQHAVMIEAVENHMPEVIVIDEIGTEAEALAARTIAERGVQLIATVHGNTLENLMNNPTLADLIGGIQPVTLSDEEARRRGTQKTVLERKAPPSFDILIEIQDKDRFALHHNVASVVDSILRGHIPRPEIRVRQEGGEFETIEEAEEILLEQPRRRREAARKNHRKTLHIYPYAISRDKLDRAIRDLGVPVLITANLNEADVLLTLKSHAKRQPQKLREAGLKNVETRTVRSNTVTQIENFLRDYFDLEDGDREHQDALTEVESAVTKVYSSGKPVELRPQPPSVRRLQHQLAESYGLTTQSKGSEPKRRVVVYPV